MLLKKYSQKRISSNYSKSEINITPLVDVMTVLMAVFMITAPLLTSGMDVDLPKAGKSSLSGADVAIDITVVKNGDIYIGKTKMENFLAMAAKLNAMRKENQNASIVISGDKHAEYGRVVSLMGQLKDAGYQRVGLKTSIDVQ